MKVVYKRAVLHHIASNHRGGAMRTSAAIVFGTALLGTAAAAQDFGFSQSASIASAQGPQLPSLGEFHVDYTRRAAAFEPAMPQVQPDAWKPPEPNWIDPSLRIAGARVKPDIKHKGLKVAFHIFDAADVDEDEPN